MILLFPFGEDLPTRIVPPAVAIIAASLHGRPACCVGVLRIGDVSPDTLTGRRNWQMAVPPVRHANPGNSIPYERRKAFYGYFWRPACRLPEWMKRPAAKQS